jgi:hypothetical protein
VKPDLVESDRLGPAVTRRRASPGAKLRLSLELFEAGVAMMRARLKRKSPRASAAAIEQMLNAWLADKPPQRLGSTRTWHREPKQH